MKNLAQKHIHWGWSSKDDDAFAIAECGEKLRLVGRDISRAGWDAQFADGDERGGGAGVCSKCASKWSAEARRLKAEVEALPLGSAAANIARAMAREAGADGDAWREVVTGERAG